MNYKCSLVHDRCAIDIEGDDWEFAADICPNYKKSDRYRINNIPIIDDTCRFYGIARTERLKKETLRFWGD